MGKGREPAAPATPDDAGGDPLHRQPAFRSATGSDGATAAGDPADETSIRPFFTEDERRRRRQPESVQDIVDRLMTGIGGGRAAPAALLGARWAEVVGDDFARRTAPGSCEAGRLVVLVANGVTASRMRFNTSQILQNAAKIVGKGTVAMISFRVSPGLGEKPIT